MPRFGFEMNEEDKWYFTLFRFQIAHELSPYYPSKFWTQTSLRDSLTNQCVHHSILSIGAYGRALMDFRNEPTGKVFRTWRPPAVPNRHHQAALVHHAKALSHLRSNIRSYGIDGRLTMAATLLFIVFENMQGNYHSSGNLIRSGIKVLTNMRNRGSDSSSGSRSILRRQWHRYQTAQQDEVDEMTSIFLRHSVQCAYIPFAHGKFAYHILLTEDEDEDEGEEDDAAVPLDSPFTFSPPQTVEQAKHIWDHLEVRMANFLSKAQWYKASPRYAFDEADAYGEQAMYLSILSELGVWLASLAYHAADTRNHRDTRGLELLRLWHSVAVVAVSCCLDPTEMAYDKFLPDFDDILHRYRLFEELPPPADAPARMGFTNEVAKIPILAFVAAKCRVARVRREVVELMGDFDRREGVWDGFNALSAVVDIMRLEGQLDHHTHPHHSQHQNQNQQSSSSSSSVSVASSSLSPSHAAEEEDAAVAVPAEARYTWANTFWDFEKRHMNVEYIKVLPNALGEFERVRCVLGS